MPASRPASQRGWLLPVASLVLCLVSGCASAPRSRQHVPPDVPRPAQVQVHEGSGFRVWVDRGCLDEAGVTALLDELARARAFLVEVIGPALAPGDFRAYGVPRADCSGPLGDAPRRARPLPERIDVVLLRGGERCHADGDGITLLASHLTRRDATHELVHYLAGSSWRPIDEGLAVYLTERLWGAAGGVPVKTRARAFLDVGLREDLDPDALREGMSRRDYDVAGAFVGWLIEAYGKETFWRLYAGPLRNYYPVYGVDERVLWERFWRYLRNLDVRHDGRYHAFRARLRGQ